MKTLVINGEKYKISNIVNLSKLIEYFDYNEKLLVVEYNKIICKKKKWAKILIKNNDTLEFVTIVGGG